MALDHHMILNMPCLILGSCWILHVYFENKQIFSGIIIGILSVFLLVFISYKIIQLKSDRKEQYCNAQAKDIVSHIPSEDLNSVYPYMVYPSFLPATEIIPPYKYFVIQDWYGRFNNEILIEIDTYMETNPPLWVITQYNNNDLFNIRIHAKFQEVLDKEYSIHAENKLFRLHRLK